MKGNIITLHTIIASEIAAKIYESVYKLIECEENLQYISHEEEVYWKDNTMLDIHFDIDVKKPLSETEWIKLFDNYFIHNDVNRDNTFLEICHYSLIGNRNDPFVAAYIPLRFCF